MQQMPFLHQFATKESYARRKATASRGLFWDEVTDETLDDDPIVNPLFGHKIKQIQATHASTCFVLKSSLYNHFCNPKSPYIEQYAERNLRNLLEMHLGTEHAS